MGSCWAAKMTVLTLLLAWVIVPGCWGCCDLVFSQTIEERLVPVVPPERLVPLVPPDWLVPSDRLDRFDSADSVRRMMEASDCPSCPGGGGVGTFPAPGYPGPIDPHEPVPPPSSELFNQEPELVDPVGATSRLRATMGGGRAGWTGTGFNFLVDREAGYVWAGTCRHCTMDERTGQAPETLELEFFDGAKATARVEARTWKQADGQWADIAVVTFPLSDLGMIQPSVVPLGGPEDDPVEGDRCVTVGCPEGQVPSQFEAQVIAGTGGEVIRFLPPPKQGRSGSGLFDLAGTKVVGVLYAQELGPARRPVAGLAVPVSVMWRELFPQIEQSGFPIREVLSRQVLSRQVSARRRAVVEPITHPCYPWDSGTGGGNRPGGVCPPETRLETGGGGSAVLLVVVGLVIGGVAVWLALRNKPGGMVK